MPSRTSPTQRQDDAYIVNGSMLANILGPWIDCADVVCMGFHAEWAAFAATSGTLSIQGSNDPTQTKFQEMTISVSHGTWPTVGATAAGAIVLIQNPPHWLRLKYTRVAGGTTNQMQAWAFGRCA